MHPRMFTIRVELESMFRLRRLAARFGTMPRIVPAPRKGPPSGYALANATAIFVARSK